MTTDYERLAEATADELFGSDKAGLPVYTLAEDEALARIVGAMYGSDLDARSAYCRTVRASLYLDQQGHSPLRWHIDATQRHLKTPLETPPSLPLLVVLTLAAESMHADSKMAANNFYGRLRPLLDVPSEREYLLVSAYQQWAHLLWRSLNAWLEAWEGERGVPTAYSLGGMPHIGLPMSQAVVRQHDRLGLIDAFEQEGLPPGLRMSPEDMELALDAYATSQPSPLSSNIRRLWSHSDARARIVQAACLELEAWSGAPQRTSDRVPVGTARLMAYVRSFPLAAVDLNIAIPTNASAVDEVVFESQHGEIAVPAILGSSGTARLAAVDLVSAESLVGETLTGYVWGDSGSARFGRRPRRVVPLRWDELQGCYIEVERVSLGEENVILAVLEDRQRITDVLQICARPGWSVLQDVAGLPSGWLLFKGIQIVAVHDKTTHVDVSPLVARSRTSLTMHGGFDLPGRLRKWSSLQPPEVIAYAAGAKAVAIRVVSTDAPTGDSTTHVSQACDGELAVLFLSDYELRDGEYQASMFVDGDQKARATSVLRLRSADTPLFRVDDADMRLVYSPPSGDLWPLSAGPASWPTYVNGARLVGAGAPIAANGALPDYVPRARHIDHRVDRVRVRIGVEAPPDSCMVTGRHRFELPPALGDRPTSRTIEGECTTCGLVKRFAATPRAATRRVRGGQNALRQPVVIPPVSTGSRLNQRVLFDALCHIGQGSYRDFERIAGQVEGTGLYADTFLRTQEALGHIDVRRDEYLRVAEWAVNAPTIVPTGVTSWALVGSHSRGLLTELRFCIGQDAVIEREEYGSIQVALTCDPPELLARRDDLAALGIELRQESPALEIASLLPPLSRVERALKRVSIPEYRASEKWDTKSATWQPTATLADVGAYRLRNFDSLYVLRSPTDLKTDSVAIGNAQLVKHVANAWAGDPLVGYHPRTSSVLTPLGASLPGLYGRALTIGSCRPPVEHVKSRLVQYVSVARSVADIVFDRLIQ